MSNKDVNGLYNIQNYQCQDEIDWNLTWNVEILSAV